MDRGNLSHNAPRIIAFYLPQFHPIPENDKWWGKGFTEWTNVGKAKPLFWGHDQPKVPADLGYYDLRVPETREAQAQLARDAGIEGFCYWHYWFGNGKRLLERPFNEVLQSGKPDFPFCLAWANESWMDKSWNKDGKDIVLIEQKYPGIKDYTEHFYAVLPAFRDKRYIRVTDKPLFMIYKPLDNIEIPLFIDAWRKLSVKNGLPGIFFVGQCFNDKQHISDYRKLDFDAINTVGLDSYDKKRNFINKNISRIYRLLFRKPFIISYKKASKHFFDKTLDRQDDIIPTMITGWDHTPRSGWRGSVMINNTPAFFGEHASAVIKNCNKKFNIVFLKSWNEWAEGNYLEPDLRWGRKYLNVLTEVMSGKL
jgi:lipopolysaccharide biosynthesis protein